MDSYPCVGVIIPIYNVEPYLRECLDSVINQTYQNLQIVLVDDGSTDASFSIAKEYFERDERITLIAQRNQGVSRARNVGIDYLLKTSEGGGGEHIQILEHSPSKSVEYIHFLDSDDWFELDCIEICVKNALQTKAEIVWHGHRLFDQWKQSYKEQYLLDGVVKNIVLSPEELFASLKYEGFSCVVFFLCGVKIFERENLRFVDGIISEDAIFGTQLFALARGIYILNEDLYTYRIRENSLSKYNFEETQVTFSPYQQEIVESFDSNLEVYLYDFSYARCVFVVEMIEFLGAHKEDFSNQLIAQIEHFISYRTFSAFWICKCSKDPKNARVLCERIWKYPQYCKRVELSSKIAFLFPRIFFVCRAILRYCKNLKYWIQSRF